jgi:hypothetical protein
MTPKQTNPAAPRRQEPAARQRARKIAVRRAPRNGFPFPLKTRVRTN